MKLEDVTKTRRLVGQRVDGLKIIASPAVLAGKNSVIERISIYPNVCHGQACIAETRIPLHQVVRMFANGDSLDDLLRAYPSITREEIFACLEYADALAEELLIGNNQAAWNCAGVEPCLNQLSKLV